MDSQALTDKIVAQTKQQLAPFQGQAGAPQALDVSSSSKRINEKLFKGEGAFTDLLDASRNSSPFRFHRYIVHRVNHIDDYNDPAKAHALDHQFFKTSPSNFANLTPRHLHEWIDLNPQVIKGAIDTRDAHQKAVLRGVGLNVRKINGKPHVALFRNLPLQLPSPSRPSAAPGASLR